LQGLGWGVKEAGKKTVLSWRQKQRVETLLLMVRERVFQMVGAGTAKLREPKHSRSKQQFRVRRTQSRRRNVMFKQ